jgi:hypothetical protein
MVSGDVWCWQWESELTFRPVINIFYSIVSDYRLDDRAAGIRSSAKTKNFSSSLCVRTSSESRLASCAMGTGVLAPGVKRGWGLTLTTHIHVVRRPTVKSYTSSRPCRPHGVAGHFTLLTPLSSVILINLCTPAATFSDPEFYPHGVLMDFIWFSCKTVIISLSNNKVVLVMVKCCVFFAIEAETLGITYMSSCFKGFLSLSTQHLYLSIFYTCKEEQEYHDVNTSTAVPWRSGRLSLLCTCQFRRPVLLQGKQLWLPVYKYLNMFWLTALGHLFGLSHIRQGLVSFRLAFISVVSSILSSFLFTQYLREFIY